MQRKRGTAFTQNLDMIAMGIALQTRIKMVFAMILKPMAV
jgi:hypothetical protein